MSSSREAAAGPRVVAIGGGHGLSATLRAARTYASELTAVVSVADDGGSSGRLRRQFAIPAPGDLRRCLVALAKPGSAWAAAFEYRFGPETGGDLEGHALGNLLIAGLAGVTGDFATALGMAADLLGADARVLPATVGAVDLAGDIDGVEVVGQVRIQDAEGEVRNLHVLPPGARAPVGVPEAITAADQVIIGPGSLFTSVLAACVVPDVHRALAGRSGGRVYVCNLRPEEPETAGFTPGDHLRVLSDHGVAVDTVVVDSRWWGAPDPRWWGEWRPSPLSGGSGGSPVVIERSFCDYLDDLDDRHDRDGQDGQDSATGHDGRDSGAGHDPGRLAEALIVALEPHRVAPGPA